MVSIAEANEMLDSIAESLPGEFFAQLNGGIVLDPDTKHNAEFPELLTLGEYRNSAYLGRSIVLYFGSLSQAFGGLPPETFAEKLRETLLHEFTHHMESLAGEHTLEVRDDARMDYYRQFGHWRGF